MRPTNCTDDYPCCVVTKCPSCGKRIKICLTEKEYDGYLRWKNREQLIQEALPELDIYSREALKTGLCKACIKKILTDN